ncbi:MAG: helix-turn-helix domain-containing protein [Erythrobacter sp.]|jgi:excisionase family DNA binding protein|nr:helix-turn-helix domain-containing protein [Erythrobacter sp.]
MTQVVPVAYNINDAAAALGLSRRSIYNLIDAGQIRKVKIGRRSVIPATDILALMPEDAA